MRFNDLNLPPSLNSSDHDLIKDFFIPLLKCAETYDRGVGYFSSGWLKINSPGLTEFAENNGKARWITSPILSENDWEALKAGDEATQDSILKEALAANIENLKTSLEQDTLTALSWLIADGILEFRLAVLRGKLDGEFHDKFGLFKDRDGQVVSFAGSYNESIQGTKNYESFKIFQSWLPYQLPYVNEDINRFEKLWSNQDQNVRVLDIGESNKRQIMQLRKHESRPYKKDNSAFDDLTDNTSVKLRDYQEIAIANWQKNSYRGFFEMATGTGKTITALAAATRLRTTLAGKLALIISVPYQHLVLQWEREAEKFGIKVIRAFKSKESWLNPLNSTIVEFNGGYRDFFCVITTNDTFCGTAFQSSIARLREPSMLIADEAHHLGTELSQRSYPKNVPYRLALSATPNRWYDEDGTAALRAFFGETVYEFSIKDAIGLSLTRYNYYPQLVELTPHEIDCYESISYKITKLMRFPDTEQRDKQIQRLLIERSDLLNKAENKLAVLSALLDEQPVDDHTLFYCAPGQIQEVTRLLGVEKHLIVHPFTNREKVNQREVLLRDFAEGKMQALTAIRCLDEGVDIPSTKKAFLLASSSNPREFIQRRGRILRKADNKNFAELYDLITVPPVTREAGNNEQFLLERQILTKEFARFKEFADTADNKHTAIEVLWNLAERYQLKHLL